MTKLVTKLDNGKFAVNKRAVIAKLAKATKARRVDDDLGVIPVTQADIDDEAAALTRYRADTMLNHSEE